MSVVRVRLFNIFAATLHVEDHSSIRNLRTRHAMMKGTHPMVCPNELRAAVQLVLLSPENVKHGAPSTFSEVRIFPFGSGIRVYPTQYRSLD